MTFWMRLQKDPFRLFFPLGALLAFEGVIPWVSQYFTHASYPRDLHRMLMINGFLLSFVTGFLMTAIPRFTDSRHANVREIGAAALFLLLAATGALLHSPTMNSICAALELVALMTFAARRFLTKKSNPPYTFIFIGIGLSLWLFSNLVLGLNNVFSPNIRLIADDLFSNGAIMSLLLGVGGRLIPGILGWQTIVSDQRQQYETNQPYLKLIPTSIWIAALVFLASYFLRPVLPLKLCFEMRFAVVLFFAVRYWNIQKFPASRSYLTWSVWLACWCLLYGYLLAALWINAYVHALHLLFVGGFSLLTLLISMRVSFAHSPAGTTVEKTSPGILVVAVLILLAAITRVTAILVPQIYLTHLGYAAMIWILGLLLWTYTIYKKLKN